MLRMFARVLAVTAAAAIAGPGVDASAATLGMSAAGTSGLGAGFGHHGTPLRSGAANRYGGPGLRSGGGYGHTNLPHDVGSHPSSGWYQRGFGGTLDPGWGYRFGPNLGGFGR